MSRTALALLAWVAVAAAGCSLPRPPDPRSWFSSPSTGPAPDLNQGIEVVDAATIIAFQARAQGFYDRLSRRRFNTFATYTDTVLRDHFQTEQAFYDYYADLAHALDEVVFQRNRALLAEVKEFAVEAPGRAVVQVRMRGDNGRPLRFWTVVVERADVWERVDGTWWVVPGKL